MKNKFLVNKLLQNTQNPQGFLGKMMLFGMNCGHARLAEWGMSHLEWQANWVVLDIGCGGGANITEILRRCPDGIVYGLDASNESVVFARNKNRRMLGRHCFIDEGRSDLLPYSDMTFDLVTAFETVYFWGDLSVAFREVIRVLKPGGLFMICNEMADPTNTMWTDLIDGMNIHTIEEMESCLLSVGFNEVKADKKKENICIVARK